MNLFRNKKQKGDATYIDVAVSLIISVVIGAVVLAGVNNMFNSIVIPGMKNQIGKESTATVSDATFNTGNGTNVTQAELQLAIDQITAHINNTNNPHNVTADQVGAIKTQLFGSPNGVATLDSNKRVNETANNAVNSDMVDGYHVNTPWTSIFSRIPLVQSDGGMEIGSYIDFHQSSNDGADFSTRLWGNSNGTLSINGRGTVYDDLYHPYASTAATLGRSGNVSYPMYFWWSGQGGQPSWLWGGNDGTNMYVYNPANFSVNYANSAGNSDKVDGRHLVSGEYGNSSVACYHQYGSLYYSDAIWVGFPYDLGTTPIISTGCYNSGVGYVKLERKWTNGFTFTLVNPVYTSGMHCYVDWTATW